MDIILYPNFIMKLLHTVYMLVGVLVGESNSHTSPCICTTVPCPVVGNNSLEEGGGGAGVYQYINHSGFSVVSTAFATITSKDLDMGTGTTTCTQEYSRMLDDDVDKDCDAGHILAHRLGGPGNQPINIFPQKASVNRGSYAQFEGSIYDCIAGGATSAYLTWSFAYLQPNYTKPKQVVYTATFTGGECKDMNGTFDNEGN
tara:strand:- start:56 stop:658 length:603 start_codon:yes stop_codon:yes gene_type:complete